MNLAEYIKNIRSKSERERHNFVVLVSAGITIIIFLMWLVNLKMTVLSGSNSDKAASTPSPFSIIQENVTKAVTQ